MFPQDPAAGKKVDPKTVEVKLTVAGVPTVAVPSVTGLDYPTAVAALEKSGFKAGPAVEEVSSDKELGLVFNQEPAADAQADPKTTEVKLTVAVGETVLVPNVTGKPLVAAQALLEDRGFTAAFSTGKPSGQQPDAVLVQEPAGDTKAPKGGVVKVTIDPGVVVPNLVNPALDGIAGIQALKNAGVEIGTIGSSCSGVPNKIIRQSIEAKTRVALGTRVNITIASSTAGARLCQAIVDKSVTDYSDKMRATTRVPATKFALPLARPTASRARGSRRVVGLKNVERKDQDMPSFEIPDGPTAVALKKRGPSIREAPSSASPTRRGKA